MGREGFNFENIGVWGGGNSCKLACSKGERLGLAGMHTMHATHEKKKLVEERNP